MTRSKQLSFTDSVAVAKWLEYSKAYLQGKTLEERTKRANADGAASIPLTHLQLSNIEKKCGLKFPAVQRKPEHMAKMREAKEKKAAAKKALKRVEKPAALPPQITQGAAYDFPAMEQRILTELREVRGLVEKLLKAWEPAKPEAKTETAFVPSPECEALAEKYREEREKKEQHEKKRVAVVGLLPGQRTMIEHEFSDKLDLRFVQADKAGSFRNTVAQCDAAVTMAQFVSHQHEDIIKTTNVKLYRVAGGLTTLRTKLNELSEGRTQ